MIVGADPACAHARSPKKEERKSKREWTGEEVASGMQRCSARGKAGKRTGNKWGTREGEKAGRAQSCLLLRWSEILSAAIAASSSGLALCRRDPDQRWSPVGTCTDPAPRSPTEFTRVFLLFSGFQLLARLLGIVAIAVPYTRAHAILIDFDDIYYLHLTIRYLRNFFLEVFL